MHKVFVVSIGFVFASIVAACSTNQAAGLTTPAGVLAAVTTTTNSQSSKMSVNVSGDVAGQTVNISGDGAFDYTKHQGELVMNVPPTGKSPGGTMTELITNQTLYVKGDQDPKWAKVDLNQVEQQTGLDPNSIGQNQADPTQSLKLLNGASDNIKKVGNETLRGTKTTHYTLNLDFDKAANNATGAQKATLQKAASLYNHQQIPTDLWVDSHKRVRKMSMTIDLSKLNVTTSTTQPIAGTMTISVELYDFGTPVTVTAPPANQVQDVTSQATSAAKQAA